MKFLTILKQSFKAIMANKVRSFLTVLGIVIGIGSVIGLMSLGTGVKESIRDQVNVLGSNNLTVTSGYNAYTEESFTSGNSEEIAQQSSNMLGTTQTLVKSDVIELEKISKDLVLNVAGYVSSSAIIEINGVQHRETVLGVSNGYFSFYDLNISSGSYLSDGVSQEIVLGSESAKNLFGETDPLGQEISISGTSFLVVGVIAKEDETSFSNPNVQVYISDTEYFTLFDTVNYNTIIAKASSEDTVDSAKAEMEKVLLKNHGIDSADLADFTVTSSEEILTMVDSVMDLLTSFLSGIASISLLVGGIGIMNIMLVSVTERTREIGLRKALGAKTSDILMQFLTESLVLTVIGGILGILVGYGIALLAGTLLDFTAVVTLDAIFLAVGISSFIGIVFGIYPAARAAKLNPIDALRYE